MPCRLGRSGEVMEDEKWKLWSREFLAYSPLGSTCTLDHWKLLRFGCQFKWHTPWLGKVKVALKNKHCKLTREHMDTTAGGAWLVRIILRDLALSPLQCNLLYIIFFKIHAKTISILHLSFSQVKKIEAQRQSDLCQDIQLASVRVSPRIHSPQKRESLDFGV